MDGAGRRRVPVGRGGLSVSTRATSIFHVRAELLARTEPGTGASAADDGGRTIARTRSIPNVPTARLERVLAAAHAQVHTPSGIRSHDGTRRKLIEQGARAQCIAHELMLRGVVVECALCRPPTP